MKFYHPFFNSEVTPVNKKYSVYVFKDGKIKLIHFGDKRYQQYHDRLGLYSHLDHHDENRRKLYRERHKYDHIDDPNYPGFWSYYCLW